MTETTTQPAPLVGLGHIVHTEFVSTDATATCQFLTNVFGIEFQNMPSDMGDYWNFGDEQLGIGGAVRQLTEEEGNNAYSAPYFNVENIDAVIDAAVGAGATLMVPKQAVPNMGHFAWFQAPGGVIVAAWENDPGATPPPA